MARLELPAGLMDRVRRAHPLVGEREARLMELGLHDWFIACAHRDGMVLGMPSKAVDWVWHEFILHTDAYERFCKQAFGGYLHHTPDAHLAVPMDEALHNTIEAWDRSRVGAQRDAVLWDLDRQVGLPGLPLRLDPEERAERARLRAARRRQPRAGRGGRGRDRRDMDGGSDDWSFGDVTGGGDGGGDGGGCGGGD